jgi:hypothetical protein
MAKEKKVMTESETSDLATEIGKIIEILKITNELLFCLAFSHMPAEQIGPVYENVLAKFKERFLSLK